MEERPLIVCWNAGKTPVVISEVNRPAMLRFVSFVLGGWGTLNESVPPCPLNQNGQTRRQKFSETPDVGPMRRQTERDDGGTSGSERV